jgi:hypothetical protein
MHNHIQETINLLFKSKNYNEFRDYSNLPKTDKIITCIGQENIVKDGPSIIIANFTGNGREIIGLLKAYDSRRLYGVMPESIFNKNATVNKVKEKLGPRTYTLVDKVAKKFGKSLESILTSIPKRLTALQMIPIDLEYTGESASPKKDVITAIKKYLSPTVETSSGIAVDYDGAVVFSYGKNNVRTVATIVCEQYKKGIDVQVTPVIFDSGKKPSERWRDIIFNTLFSKTTMYIGKSISLEKLMDTKDPETDPMTLIPELTNRISYRIAKSVYNLEVLNKTKNPQRYEREKQHL